MHDIKGHLHEVLASLHDGVRLVAVGKYHPCEDIMAAYDAGQRIFGENHVQELVAKEAAMPKDVEWHFIGHLQTNKVKYIASFISLIHSVKVLLELHVAQEDTKYGLSLDACRNLLEEGSWRELQHVQICGLMTMASNVDDEEQIRSELMAAADFFDEVKEQYFADSPEFCERSWGMSHDYPIAVECRSTIVRVGTTIFGERKY